AGETLTKAAAEWEPFKTAIQSDADGFSSLGDSATRLGRYLDLAGKSLGFIDSSLGAVSAFKNSDSSTTEGKVADGALAAGSKLLAGAAWPAALTDALTGGELSKLYFAGGKAIAALVSAAQGDFEPAAKFDAEAARGDQGWVAKELSSGVATLQNGAPEAL